MAPLFRYDPEVTDILADVVSPTALEQLLRRDHELEDYLNHLPTGGGAVTTKTDLFQITGLNGGGFPAVPDSTNVNPQFTLAQGDGIATPNTNGLTVNEAGLYLGEMEVLWDFNGVGWRRTYISMGGSFGVPHGGTEVPGCPGPIDGTDTAQRTWGSGFGLAAAGELVVPVIAQNSGAPLNLVPYTGFLKITKVG